TLARSEMEQMWSPTGSVHRIDSQGRSHGLPRSPKNWRRMSLFMPMTSHPCWQRRREHSEPIRPPEPEISAFIVTSRKGFDRIRLRYYPIWVLTSREKSFLPQGLD